MTEDSKQDDMSRDMSLYVKTHCGTCVAGWTRRDSDGRTVYWCLLDQQQPWPRMTYCSRYSRARHAGEPSEPEIAELAEAGDPQQH